MSEINWSNQIITAVYPNIIKDKGADLDRNGRIAGNEVLADKNKNGVVGDNEDFLAYLDRNSNILKAAIPFVEYGAGLSPENRIHQLMLMESTLVSPYKVKLAYDKLTAIIKTLKERLTGEYADMSLEDKLLQSHKIIKELGYKYATSNNTLLMDDLVSNQLDCDTSSFVILALADELKKVQPEWESVGMVNIPYHSILEYKGKYFDLRKDNRWFSEESYIKELNLPQNKELLRNMFKPHYGEEIVSIFYDNCAIARAEKGQYDKAIAGYTKALELNPHNSMTYSNRGIAWAEKGEQDKAIADYTKAIELNPNYVSAYNNRGNAWADIKEYDKAVADFTKALELDPSHENARANLKICLDKKEAAKQ